jgi:hypothetical protein
MLRDPEAHASMLNPPFSLQAEDNGLRKLADLTDVLGPYLGNAGWAMRDWSRANAETVQRYLSAYVESIRWMLNPANTEARQASSPNACASTPPWHDATSPSSPRLAPAPPPTGRFDLDGFRNVLRIRAEVLGNWGGTPPPPERYLDLSYWERAVAAL